MRTFLIIAVIWVAPAVAAADCANHTSNKALVAQYNTPLRSSAMPDGTVVVTLNPGAVTEILQTGNCETISGVTGKWVRVRSYRPTEYRTPDAFNDGWLFDAGLAYEDSFESVTLWNGPPQLYFGGGDYVDQFAISKNGRYLREYSTESDMQTERGQLFRSKDVFMTRRDNQPTNPFERLDINAGWPCFYRDNTGHYCAHSDMNDRGLCPKGPIEGSGPQ